MYIVCTYMPVCTYICDISDHRSRRMYVPYTFMYVISYHTPNTFIVRVHGPHQLYLIHSHDKLACNCFSYLDERLELSRPYNQTEVNTRYFEQVEEPFTFSAGDYPHVPTGRCRVQSAEC